MDKAEALRICNQCPKDGQKGCIKADIEGSRSDEVNPPECLLFQFNAILDGGVNHVNQDVNQVNQKTGENTSIRSASTIIGGASTKKQVKIPVSGARQPSSGARQPKCQPKNGCPTVPPAVTLTTSEQEVLRLIKDEHLSTGKIKIVRGCSRQAVNKIIKSLKKKGFLGYGNMVNHLVDKSESSCQPSEGACQQTDHSIRLHGQEFNIRILHKDERYTNIIGKVIDVDGNTVRCYRESVEIYSGKSFFAADAQKATAKSFKYWNGFFARLETDLNVVLTKPRTQNIKLVANHYSEVNNELASECEKKGDKIRVYTTEDGKLWFTIDNSFNLREAETQHGQTGEEDMQQVVQPFFNDMRDNKPPKISEITKAIHDLVIAINKMAEENHETASGLNAVAVYLKNQLPKETEKKLREPENPKSKWDKELEGYG